MSVNSAFKGLVKNQFLLIGGLILAIGAVLLTTSFTKSSRQDLFVKQVNLTVRELGHHLLLRSGDSTSRVMPVTQTSPGVFLLKFESEFGFQPDTLISLTQRLLKKTGLSEYTVTVHECQEPEIVYGFHITPTADTSVARACIGRTQPQGCYFIEIAFADFESTSNYGSAVFLVSGVFLAMLVVVVVNRFKGTTKQNISELPLVNVDHGRATLKIGSFVFDTKNSCLRLANEKILLTDKECKVLELLNNNFGGLTTREALIVQVWSSEGVITGRSLDVFISKLRKKLSADPQIRITNVHGRGYKLEKLEGA